MEQDTCVILPTYNERGNIAAMVRAIFSAVPKASLLVVDDNSPDGTGSIVHDLQKEFPRLSLLSRKGKEGLGKAYLHAFREVLEKTDAKRIIMMDADFSHDPSYLPEMIRAAERYDVVIGSRYIPGGRTEGWELRRRLLSRWGNRYARTIIRTPVHDCTGGFILISREALKRLPLEAIDSAGYAFMIELKYLLLKTGSTFTEMPIVFKNRTEGASKISNNIIREGLLAPWRMAWKRHR